jgi:hypothetical protein
MAATVAVRLRAGVMRNTLGASAIPAHGRHVVVHAMSE